MTDESGSSQDEGLYDVRRRNSTLKTIKRKIAPISELAKVREKWDVFSATQNLPAALNDPSHRETDLFTKTWGDYFIPHAPLPPSSLPNIELADFLRYLKETSAGRKSHRHIMRELNKTETPPSSPIASSPSLPVRQVKEGGRLYDLSNIPKVFNQKDFTLVDPRTFVAIIPLSQILPNSTSAGIEGVDGNGPSTSLQPTKLLHEKLTHHLDVIEVHLAHQISMKSDVFFSILASQRQLELLIMEVRQDVVKLRNQLSQVDKLQAHPLLALCSKCRRKTKLSVVCDKLSLIATVHQTQQTIQLLLSTSDFVGALELIYRTQAMLANDLRGVSSLRHLGLQLSELEKAIENLMEADFVNFAMVDIRGRVAEAEGAESPDGVDTEIQLESIVKGLLRQRKQKFLLPLKEELDKSSRLTVKEVVERYLQINDTENDENGNEDESEDTGMSLGEKMRAMDFNSWHKLLDHTFSSLLVYMRCVEKTLKVIGLTCQEEAGVLTPLTPTPLNTPTRPHPLSLLGSITDSEETVGTTEVELEGVAGKEVEFEGVLEHESEDRLDQLMMEDDLSDAHIEAMAKMAEQNIAKQEEVEETKDNTTGDSTTGETKDNTTAAEQNKGPPAPLLIEVGGADSVLTAGECQELLFQCHELLSVVCDVLHSRCTKIMAIRAKAGLLDNLVPTDFVQLVRTVGRFIDTSAGIIGRPCPHLQYVLISQAKNFLEHFHDSRKNKLNILLDGERWRQSEVPPEIQKVAQQLEEGRIAREEDSSPSPSPKHNATLSSQTSVHAEQYLIVHSQRFPVVSVLLMLLKIVSDYCQIVDDLPNLITDILTRLVDMLKFFNSRTCQLVLGAGAVEMVGLKTITTRQLALVFRCLQAVMLLIPDIKAHFRKRLTPKKCVLLQQFDQVQEDIGSHCREINHKIVLIMNELFTRTLLKWEAKSPTPSHSFKVIIKQLLKLHESLSDIFPPDHLQALFQGIEDGFKVRLKSQLTKLGISNNGSTEHGVVNAELTNMKGSLELLDNVTAFGNSLFDVWTINR